MRRILFAAAALAPVALLAQTPFLSSAIPVQLHSTVTSPQFLGMQVSVGSTPLTVTSVGRWCAPGNSESHMVKFVLHNSGTNATDVAGGGATVAMAGCTTSNWTYAPLASQITLAANTLYDLVSQEDSGDNFYDWQTGVTSTSVGTVPGPIYAYNGYTLVASPNDAYGPVNFQYTTGSGSGGSGGTGGSLPLVTGVHTGTLRSNVTGYFGMAFTVGSSPLSVPPSGATASTGTAAPTR